MPQKKDPRITALLTRADEALEHGDPEQALEVARELESLAPGTPEATLLAAEALLALGRDAEADRLLLAATSRHPSDLTLWYARAEGLVHGEGEDPARIEEGLEVAAKGLKLARKQEDLDFELDFLVLGGVGHNLLGECTAALEVLDAAVALNPTDVEARLERGVALFELCRFDEAQALLTSLAREVPDEPWVHHTLGLLAERRRDHATAERCFARARELSPEEFPSPVELGEESFDRAVEDAMARLPEAARAALENTLLVVEDFPSDEDLLASTPPLSPTILGLFRGQAVPHRELFSPTDHFPATVLLYQRNLERFAHTREELLEQIGITVLHEVGHLLGLDEDALWERGLD